MSGDEIYKQRLRELFSDSPIDLDEEEIDGYDFGI